MLERTAAAVAAAVLAAVGLAATGAAAPRPTAPSPFSNTRLTVPLTQTFEGIVSKTTGDSEPAIAIGQDGTMAVDGLAWIPFQVNLWRGKAGSTPAFFGAMDTNLSLPGRVVLGDGDADVDIATTGTTHLADLDFVGNNTITGATLGVSVTNCPRGATGPADCTSHIIDTAGADREWITSDGQTVWVSYHDSGSSTLIHIQRSDDDGATWKKVGDPIPGQGAATGDATFNNDQGPIVADPTTHFLFDIFAAGEAGIQKGSSADFNNIWVARSTNGGVTWTTTKLFTAPLFTPLNNVFPSLAVDPVTGALHAVWSDRHSIFLSSSTDHGRTWSAARVVSTIPTVVFPWVAAYNGKVDVVYYGTFSNDKDSPAAVWNTYDAQVRNGNVSELKVSNTVNHIGPVCTSGIACAPGTRNLLDLFEVAEDPATGKASVIYTDDTFNTFVDTGTTLKLPEIVLAQEN